MNVSRKAIMALAWKIRRRDGVSQSVALKRAWLWAKKKAAPPALGVTAALAEFSAATHDLEMCRRYPHSLELTDEIRQRVQVAADALEAAKEAARGGTCLVPFDRRQAGIVSPRCSCGVCVEAHLKAKRRDQRNYSASCGGW